jgi:hypothetical protein
MRKSTFLYPLILLVTMCFSPSQEKKYFSLILEFNHQFGEESFQIGQGYQTLLKDSVKFTKLMYYLSNIQLHTSTTQSWKERESYRLIQIDTDKSSNISIRIDSIPAQSYRKLSFGIGIDSIRNHGGSQKGDLDPLKGMFWTWEQGYVFFKAEGYFYPKSGDKGAFVIHLGRNPAYKEVSFGVSPTLFETDKTPILQYEVNMQQLFGGIPNSAIHLKMPPNKKSISIMGGEKAIKFAQNMLQMFHLRQK